MYNWDYDKLFTSGNIVGLKNIEMNKIFVREVFTQKDFENYFLNNVVNWVDYRNESLSCENFQIEYIIRLDSHGNVVERIFDREHNMIEDKPMPELKPGMFGKVLWYEDGEFEESEDEFGLFVVVDQDLVVYQNGGYDYIDYISDLRQFLVFVELYENTCSFKQCHMGRLAWRNPRYQAWLDKQEG